MFKSILLFGFSIATPVIRGSPVEQGKYPFIARFRSSRGSSCSGIIVDQQTLITVAHCSVGFGEYQADGTFRVENGITIYANNINRNLNKTSPNAVRFDVESIIISPQYDQRKLSNDMAIWKVKVASGDATLIPKVEMDNGDFSRPGTILTIAGFGNTNPSFGYDGKYVSSPKLLSIDVPAVDSTECSKIYSGLEGAGFDSSSHICAGDLQGYKGACDGDSGSPLFYMNGKTPILVGLVSHGYGNKW